MTLDYFLTVVNSLKIDEVTILGFLQDQDADMEFKAIKRGYLFEISKLTEANFRKTLNRLEALQFVKISVGGKEHHVYISPFGKEALSISVEGVKH